MLKLWNEGEKTLATRYLGSYIVAKQVKEIIVDVEAIKMLSYSICALKKLFIKKAQRSSS